MADNDLGWREKARCQQADPDLFFPDNVIGLPAAREICSLCTVSSECLEYALAHDERFGVWGGTSESERRKIARVLAARALAEASGS